MLDRTRIPRTSAIIAAAATLAKYNLKECREDEKRQVGTLPKPLLITHPYALVVHRHCRGYQSTTTAR